jgi:dipeptidase
VLGTIAQVQETYGYWDSWYGIANDHHLMIGESTCNARETGVRRRRDGSGGMFDIGELTRVAMERCKTVKCAIETMGALAVEHGFYSEGDANDDYEAAECLGIVDSRGDAWVFHLVSNDHIVLAFLQFALANFVVVITQLFLSSPQTP